MRRTRILTGLFVVLAVSLAIAWPATIRIGNSTVDVGLDFSTAADVRPSLEFGGSADAEVRSIAMARVPDQFAPRVSRFEVESTGERHPDSGGHEIALRALPEKRIVDRMKSVPDHQWHIAWGESLTFGDSPSRLQYEEMGGPVTLEFFRSPWSGIATVRSFDFEERLDLFGEEGGRVSVSLPFEQWSRYHARVPRRYLGEMAIQFAAESNPPVARLYVATLIPRIFFGGKSYPGDRWGRVTTEWSPAIVDGRMVLPSTGLMERGGVATFLCVSGLAAAVLCGGLVGLYGTLRAGLYLWRLRPATPREPAAFSWRLYGVLFVAFMVVLSAYLAMYYPGMENGDSRMQLEETRTGEYHDNHPVVHTLYIGALRWVRGSWDIVAVSQMAMIAAVLSAAFAFLVQLRTPRVVWGVVVALALFSPRIGTMSVAIWKDVPYAVLVLALTLLIARFFTDERVRRRWWYWISLSLVLALIPLIRHNGAALLVLMVPIAGFCFAPYRVRALLSVTAAILFFLAAKFLFYPMILAENYGGDATPDFWVKAKTLRDSRLFLAKDPPVSPETYSALEEVRILNPEDNTLLFGTDRFGVYEKNRAYNYKHAISEAGLVQQTRATVTEMLWRAPLLSLFEVWFAVRLPRAEFLVRRHDNIQWGFFVPYQRTYDLIGTWDDNLHSQYVRWRDEKFFVYSQPALAFYIVMLSSLLCWRRSRDIRLLTVYAPAIANSLAVAAVAASASDRYHFPLELSAGFLFCFAFLPWRRAGEGIYSDGGDKAVKTVPDAE